MTLNEALDKIKSIWQDKIKLSEAKLVDGTLISYTTLEVGSIINSIDTEGNQTPIVNGTYTMEDGTVLVVGDGGAIATITKPDAEDTSMNDTQESTPNTPTITKVTETKVTETKMKRIKVKSELATTIKEIDKYEVIVNEDTFEVGSKLTSNYVNDDGSVEVYSVSDGEYETPDGGKILVDSDGIVRLVTPKINQEEMDKEKIDQLEQAVTSMTSVIEKLSNQISKLETIEVRLEAIEKQPAGIPAHESINQNLGKEMNPALKKIKMMESFRK